MAGSADGPTGSEELELGSELLELGADDELLELGAAEELLEGLLDSSPLDDDGSAEDDGSTEPLPLDEDDLPPFPKQLVAMRAVEARTRSNFLLFILFPPFKVYCIFVHAIRKTLVI